MCRINIFWSVFLMLFKNVLYANNFSLKYHRNNNNLVEPIFLTDSKKSLKYLIHRFNRGLIKFCNYWKNVWLLHFFVCFYTWLRQYHFFLFHVLVFAQKKMSEFRFVSSFIFVNGQERGKGMKLGWNFNT